MTAVAATWVVLRRTRAFGLFLTMTGFGGGVEEGW